MYLSVLETVGFAKMTQDEDTELVNVSLSLYGELIKFCFPIVQSSIPEFLPLIHSYFAPDRSDNHNNACWVIGMAFLEAGEIMSEFAPRFLENLLSILHDHDAELHIKENAAIAIGRMCIHCSQAVADGLCDSINVWCESLCAIR